MLVPSMRSLPARAWPFVLAAAVLGGWRAAIRAQPALAADQRVIAPGPEVAGASARGAADVAAAQKLARGGKVTEAVALLEKVSVAQPSVVHDCNLSLAYLRAGRLTEAQLVWDVSQLRGATPPEWCGPSLSAQLAAALRDKHYVPLAVQVTPEGATIEIAGHAYRGLPFIWLPPGAYTAIARDGDREQAAAVLVAPPAATVTIRIAEPVVAPVDAAVTVAPPIDAGVEAPPVDAASVALPAPPPTSSRATWPAYVGVGVGGVGAAVGALYHVRALDTKERADELTAGSAAFARERDRFGTQRALAITGYAVGAAALGFAAFWWLTAPDERPAPAIGVVVGEGGATFTVGGALP